MRAAIVGAAFLAGTAALAVTPAASAQQYSGYPGMYGNYTQATYGPQTSGGYSSGYGGGYQGASPYAGVCATLAYNAATQGYAALATSPYTATCEYLGLMGSVPGAGFTSAFRAGYPGSYGSFSAFGQNTSYPYMANGSSYGSVYGTSYASNPYLPGDYGSYAPSWPFSTP